MSKRDSDGPQPPEREGWHTFNQLSAVGLLLACIYHSDEIARRAFALFDADFDALGPWRFLFLPLIIIGIPWLYWELAERTRQRRVPVPTLLLVLALGAAAAYWTWTGLPARESIAEVAPALAALGDRARVRAGPRSLRVGPDGGSLSLADGARITVPPGAFGGPRELTAAIVDLDLPSMPAAVAQSRVYAISTRESVDRLDRPVVLELPEPTDRVLAFALEDQGWRRLAYPAGPTTRLEIDHFSFVYIAVATLTLAVAAEMAFNISDSVLGALEGMTQRRLKIDRAIVGEDPVAVRERQKKEQADVLVRAFFGVGERPVQSMSQMCDEFRPMLRRYDKPQNLEVPSRFPIDTVGWLGQRVRRVFGWDEAATPQNDMSMFLQVAEAPKNVGGAFYRVVDLSMDRIRTELTSRDGQVSPAQFLEIAIEANGGNVPLGMLAAHNVLKDITYLGRDGWSGNRDISEYGLLASKLQSWRQDENIKPGSGDYDKMGPLYHIFAAMTAAYWLPSFIGERVDSMEQILRQFSVGADLPDTEQASADDCGIRIGSWAYRGFPRDVLEPVAGNVYDESFPWDDAFGRQQHLIHVIETSSWKGNTPVDYWFLFHTPPRADGVVVTPDGHGGTWSRLSDTSRGPFKTARDVCDHAVDITETEFNAWNSNDSFDCRKMPPRRR